MPLVPLSPPTLAQSLPWSPEEKGHKVDCEEGCLEVDSKQRLVIQLLSEEELQKGRQCKAHCVGTTHVSPLQAYTIHCVSVVSG